jgi:glycosyltransferase involved in cell wall biosynthesis
MKILHILNSPNWSGASSYCVSLCHGQMLQGHQVLLMTEPGKPLEQAKKLRIPFDDTVRLNHRNPGLYLHALKRMQRLMSQFQPDIISSHINEGAWMAGMVARQAAPRACVIRTRGDIDPPKGHAINRFVHHAWTDHIIVSSLLHKRLCQNILNFSPEKIDVVYAAIDIQRYSPTPPSGNLRRELGIAPGVPLVGMAARLDPVKGHEHVIAAIHLLKNCPIQGKFVFLGNENQRTFDWLRCEAEKAGVADRIAGLGYRPDIEDIQRECDIGLIASIGSEANCRVALEFMACGKPVVATRVGVIPEIVIDEEHGLLTNPQDPAGLAACLARLFLNPPVRQALGRNAREHVVRNFSIPLFLEKTQKAYAKALAAKSSGS